MNQLVMNIINTLHQELFVVQLVQVHHTLAEITAYHLLMLSILVVYKHAMLHGKHVQLDANEAMIKQF